MLFFSLFGTQWYGLGIVLVQHTKEVDMRTFAGKVAVVTGAASGVGRAVARKAALEGMHVLAADVDETGLAETVAGLENAQLVLTDVSSSEANEALAATAFERFGGVHLVHLNAGVLTNGYTWENTEQDWRWVLDVNLWGVIHGVRSFIPRMLEQGEPAHVVVTAAVWGLSPGPAYGPYATSKSGVVCLAETLSIELQMVEAPIRVSCLCPGPIATGIFESERNRMDSYASTRNVSSTDPNVADLHQAMAASISDSMDPAVVADLVFDAVRNEKFWVYTHSGSKDRIAARNRAVLEELHPSEGIINLDTTFADRKNTALGARSTNQPTTQ